MGLFSRNRKSYPHLKHIWDEINSIPCMLDGDVDYGIENRKIEEANGNSAEYEIKYLSIYQYTKH